MKINFVIPTYNEALVIEKNLQTVLNFFAKNFNNHDWQIILADNGSGDKTIEIAKKISENNPRLIVWQTNQKGRGQALKKVWQTFPANIVGYMDADLATDLKHLPELINALNTADLAVGTRLGAESKTSRSFFREMTSRIYNFLAGYLVPLPVSDTQCGFKAMTNKSAELLLPLAEHPGWFFDTELLGLAKRFKLKVVEIPVSWQETPDKKRKSSVKVFETAIDYIKQLIKLRRRLAQWPKK